MNHHYNDALQLEVSILEALLQRNRCSQARAKYFQRTNMVLRAIRKSKILEFSGGSMDAWKQGIADRILELEGDNSSSNSSSKRPRETELWDRASLQNDYANTNNKRQLPLLDAESTETLQWIQTTVQNSLPRLLDRIQWASPPLFLEISRGFFLPFCTMAIAALARIRVLLQRFGHAALDALQEVQQQLSIVGMGKRHGNNNTNNNNQLQQQQLGFSIMSSKAMVECRTVLSTDVSDIPTSSSSLVHNQKLRRLKESLGFTTTTTTNGNNKKKKKKKSGSGDDDAKDNDVYASADDERGIEERGTVVLGNDDDDGSDNSTTRLDNAPHITNSNDGSKAINIKDNDDDDDDIGEAVLSTGVTEDNEVEAFASSAATAAASITQLKKKKDKASKSKKKKKKNGNEPAAAVQQKRSASPTQQSSGGKTGKKKKRKKQDNFFDNLFD